MAKVTFNEQGQMVNAETGEVIADMRNGGYSFKPGSGRGRTLEELGVSVPVPTEREIEEDENHERSLEKQADEYERKQREKELEEDGGDSEGDRPESGSGNGVRQPSVLVSHADSGDTSFDARRTKYEVRKDSYFTIRFGLVCDPDDGRVITIGFDKVDEFRDAEPHWVKFRMWSYPEELEWKDKATEYNSRAKSQYINEMKLNEMKIRRLLLDWSFAEHEDRLKLLHCDGVLSDESYSVFMGLYPSIASTIVDMMNSVLEGNQ